MICWHMNHLFRNQGLLQGELEFSLSPKADEKQQLEYKLSLGDHTVTGSCTSRKEGQQLGAQAMLKVCTVYSVDIPRT